MASIGLGIMEGKRLYDEQVQRRRKMDEYQKNAPVREAGRKVALAQAEVNLDNLQDYFSTLNKATRKYNKEMQAIVLHNKQAVLPYMEGAQNGDPEALANAFRALYKGGDWKVTRGANGDYTLVEAKSGLHQVYPSVMNLIKDLGDRIAGPEAVFQQAQAVYGMQIENAKEIQKQQFEFDKQKAELDSKERIAVIADRTARMKALGEIQKGDVFGLATELAADDLNFILVKDDMGTHYEKPVYDPDKGVTTNVPITPTELSALNHRASAYAAAEYAAQQKGEKFGSGLVQHAQSMAASEYETRVEGAKRDQMTDGGKGATGTGTSKTTTNAEIGRMAKGLVPTDQQVSTTAKPTVIAGAQGYSPRLAAVRLGMRTLDALNNANSDLEKGASVKPATVGDALGSGLPTAIKKPSSKTDKAFYDSLDAEIKQEVGYNPKTNEMFDRGTGTLIIPEDVMPAQ